MNVEAAAGQFRSDLGALTEEIGKRIVGHRPIVDGVVTALLAGGHVLLEGVPGLGKTMLVRTLAEAIDLTFSRIQFTPDLMPADVVGTNMILEDDSGRKRFEFQRGPIFAHIVLADEINRATPKTQSAMLEAMQEHAVTVAKKTYPLEEPFFALAISKKYVRYGSSPRGAQAVMLGAKLRALVESRFSASCEDIRRVAPSALRHRLILNFEGEAEGVDPDRVIGEILQSTPEQV